MLVGAAQFGVKPNLFDLCSNIFHHSNEQLARDLTGFMSSVILQNCHPDGAIIETLVARTSTYLEKGFVKPSAKANVQWSFGSNVEGWWFMREVPG